jgi:hypothetical protein
MTTVFDAGLGNAPTTHVFAVGVGAYPHLIDGTAKLAAKPLGLSQLTSPPHSAKAVLEWFLAAMDPRSISGFQNATVPLGTVEALVSAANDTSVKTPAGEVVLARATRDNVQEAFDLWLERVRANDTNIGVFYFCGHGISAAQHYLLADDFGRNKNAPWNNAFDVSTTIRAIERYVKGSVYFFIDACREVSKDVALTLGANPAALQALDLSKPVVRTSSTLIEATGETRLAFGTEGKVSRFTQALLKALSGYCGIKQAGSQTWNVDGESLAPAIRQILERENKDASRRQVSDQLISGSPAPLVRLPTIPQVMVELDLSPEAKRKHSRLYMRSAKGALHQQLGANGPMSTTVPRGMYCIGADPIKVADFVAIVKEDEELIPPYYDLMLTVVP